MSEEAEIERLKAELEKATGIIALFHEHINSAGLHNLSNGVQLGSTVWYVKMSDAMGEACDFLGLPK
jgi:hypothetical protein